MVTDLIERPDPRLGKYPMPEEVLSADKECLATSGKWVCTLPLDHQPTLHQGWAFTELCAIWEGDASAES